MTLSHWALRTVVRGREDGGRPAVGGFPRVFPMALAGESWRLWELKGNSGSCFVRFLRRKAHLFPPRVGNQLRLLGSSSGWFIPTPFSSAQNLSVWFLKHFWSLSRSRVQGVVNMPSSKNWEKLIYCYVLWWNTSAFLLKSGNMSTILLSSTQTTFGGEPGWCVGQEQERHQHQKGRDTSLRICRIHDCLHGKPNKQHRKS